MVLLPLMMMICLETSKGAVYLRNFEVRVSASTHKMGGSVSRGLNQVGDSRSRCHRDHYFLKIGCQLLRSRERCFVRSGSAAYIRRDQDSLRFSARHHHGNLSSLRVACGRTRFGRCYGTAPRQSLQFVHLAQE